MGYYTNFNLEWERTETWKDVPNCSHSPPSNVKFCSECGVARGVRGLDMIVGDYIEEELNGVIDRDGRGHSSSKWYDYEDDMKKMSTAIPGVVFHLRGEGEENGDIWDLFALDGKVQKHYAQIIRVTAPTSWDRI